MFDLYPGIEPVDSIHVRGVCVCVCVRKVLIRGGEEVGEVRGGTVDPKAARGT